MRATTTNTPRPLRTYRMHERAEYPDFDIRFQGARDELKLPHRHGYFQIQVGLEGATQQSIGAAVRPFGAGYLSFVLPHRVHVILHPPGSRYCIVNFDQRFLWPQMDVDALDLDDLDLRSHPDLAPFLFQEHIDFAFEPPVFERIVGWLNELVRLNAERRLGATTSIRGLLHLILGLACSEQEASLLVCAQKHNGRASRRAAVQRVMRYVRENLTGEISLTEAAAAAFLSPNYLANLLKRETGQTFTEVVTERRMARAKELLVTSASLVREIAVQCGYNDEAYFNRRFRQCVGSTPRRFRSDYIAKLRT